MQRWQPSALRPRRLSSRWVPNPVPLPNCPDPLLPGKCAVDTAAQVLNPVGNLSAVRIGQSGQGSLLIGDSASLIRQPPGPGDPAFPGCLTWWWATTSAPAPA
jgi:hypothetical protein